MSMDQMVYNKYSGRMVCRDFWSVIQRNDRKKRKNVIDEIYSSEGGLQDYYKK